MQKKNYLILVLIAVVIVGGVIVYQQIYGGKASNGTDEAAWKESNDKYDLTVVIKPYQFGEKKECRGVWREGITVYDATIECGKAANLNIKTIYDPEVHKANLIDEIIGIKNGSNNRFWLYYVNGKFITTKAVDLLKERNSEPMPEKFYLQPGDRIEWRFEEWVTLAESKAK